MKFKVLAVLVATALACGCGMESACSEPDNSVRANFDAFWTIFDREYALFSSKDVDWDRIYAEYSPLVENSDLFSVLTEIADRLQDGHIRLNSPERTFRCTSWKEGWPVDFQEGLPLNYLENPEYIGKVTFFGFLPDGRTAYLRYPDFTKILTDYNYSRLDRVFSRASGIIVDIRQNIGGDNMLAEKMASHFYDRETVVGSHAFNCGRRSTEMRLYPAVISPSEDFNWSGRNVVVIADRGSYSSANYFVICMRRNPRVKIVGGVTGGGAGLAITRELPNGWLVSLSTGDTLDPDGNSIENGIEPDVTVHLDASDAAAGRDSLIEAAMDCLYSQM